MRERSVLVVMAALIVGGCEGLLGDSAAGPRGGPGGPVDPNDPGAPINPGQPLVCEEEPPGRRVLRLLTRDEYRATVADLLGIAEPNVDAFPVESAVRGYDNEANAQLVTGRHIDAYLDASAQVAAGVDPLRFVDCDVSAADCQRRFVERFGQRAFRRPLASDEVDRFTALFATQLTQGDARVGARLVVEAMLAAPSFLYRSEVGELQSDGTYALTSWEVASALSYLFWGTMPDDALFALAESDSLRDPSAVEREARRLLEDERSEPSIAAFVGRWLGTVRLLGTNRDASLFPGFSNAVRESMLAEEREFVRHVMFEGSGEFHELFDADYVLVDGNLRSYYGLGDGGSATFERVAAPAERRGGLLVMGSVMATHAHSNESSPIRRGLFVRDRLLCHDLPPPPANVDATPPGLDPTLTTRERFAAHDASLV